MLVETRSHVRRVRQPDYSGARPVADATKPQEKEHLTYRATHVVPLPDNVRETLRWYDKYLGPAGAAR